MRTWKARNKIHDIVQDIKAIKKKHAENEISKLKNEIDALTEVNAKFLDKELERIESYDMLVSKLGKANTTVSELKVENKLAYDSALKRLQEIVELKNELNFYREKEKET
ncbi:MAG: hypothetical protein GY870_12505 [archaeon]|nr:hypothetical protein [archaeon]